MRLVIIAVGRARKGPEAALFASYAKRIRAPLRLVEVEDRRPASPAERVAREGALIRQRIGESARVVALDQRGEALSSEQLADRLGRWADEGAGEVCFLIGGADGLAPELAADADLVLSLGPMTWPHLLARAMLCEQIYRAEAILAGHPYHRAGPPPGA